MIGYQFFIARLEQVEANIICLGTKQRTSFSSFASGFLFVVQVISLANFRFVYGMLDACSCCYCPGF